MEQKLKNRLVGATVILALMAFFLPLILDSKKYKTEIVSQIPPMPQAQESSPANTEIAPEQDSGTLVIDLDKGKEAISNHSKEQEPTTVKQEVSANSDNKANQNDIASVKPNPSKATTDKTEDKEKKSGKGVTNTTQPKKVVKNTVEKKPTKVATKKSESKNTKPKSVATTKPKPKSKPPVIKEPVFKESAYVIQIGSFSNKDNASKLVSELRKNEYRAYQRISKDFSRVFVGPYPEKSIAESRSKKLAKIVGNSVKVIEFDPIKH